MCQKCELLAELYEATEKTPRLYWAMTELFVMLHGSDECCENKEAIRTEWKPKWPLSQAN